jgi:MYXO-CTERM domain-containing protein
MNTANLIRSLVMGSVLALGVSAQTTPDSEAIAREHVKAQSQAEGNVPYKGRTAVPNDAADNDTANYALSGKTPETNSTLQKSREDMGFDLGWLGLFGLAGLFGLRRGNTARTTTHGPTATTRDMNQHTAEMHRG